MLKKWFIGLLFVGLVFGSVGVVLAQDAVDDAPKADETAQREPILRGRVAAIQGATLNVSTQRGQVLVLTDENTRFQYSGEDEPGLDAVQIDDHVVVWGQRNGQGGVQASEVLILPKGAVRVQGSVQSATDGAFALSTHDLQTGLRGQLSVLANQNTRYFAPDAPDAGPDNVQVGDQVDVVGVRDEGGRLLAAIIRVQPDQRQARLQGIVADVGSQGFGLDSKLGIVSVQVNAETNYHLPAVQEPGLDDVQTGDKLVVAGLVNEDGSLLAQEVGVPTQNERKNFAVAKVAAVEGARLTLERGSGEQIDLLTDENTLVLVPGLSQASPADLHVGETVGVQAIRRAGEDDAYAALVIVVRDANGEPVVLGGKLLSVDGDVLTLAQGDDDQIRLLIDENTSIFVAGLEQATLKDLEVGKTIIAQVVTRADGELYASAVGSGYNFTAKRQVTLRGQIEALDGNVIRLNTQGRKISVLTDENTQFRLPGVEEPGLDDLNVGQTIGARGHWEQDGSLHARLIGVQAAQSISP